MTPTADTPVARATPAAPPFVAVPRPSPHAVPPAGALVAVTGASGGVGASVVAAALAVRAVAAGRASCVVDLDPLGGGLDVVLGLEQTAGTRWVDLAGLDGEADGRAVLPTLPRADGVPVLSHDRHGGGVGPSVVRALVSALLDVCDLVVLDLPRPGRLPGGLPPLDRHLVVAGTRLAQVAALSAVLTQLALPPDADPRHDQEGRVGRGRDLGGACGVLLRQGVASGADAHRVAELVRHELGAPVLGLLPDDRSVTADLVHGKPPGTRSGPLARALDPVLAQVLTHRSGAAA